MAGETCNPRLFDVKSAAMLWAIQGALSSGTHNPHTRRESGLPWGVRLLALASRLVGGLCVSLGLSTMQIVVVGSCGQALAQCVEIA
jgi:hypothetical protein